MIKSHIPASGEAASNLSLEGLPGSGAWAVRHAAKMPTAVQERT